MHLPHVFFTAMNRFIVKRAAGKKPLLMQRVLRPRKRLLKPWALDFCGGTPADIEVRRSEGERPEIVLHGAYREAAEMKKVTFIHLSMSHCRQYAVAQVILEASE